MRNFVHKIRNKTQFGFRSRFRHCLIDKCHTSQMVSVQPYIYMYTVLSCSFFFEPFLSLYFTPFGCMLLYLCFHFIAFDDLLICLACFMHFINSAMLQAFQKYVTKFYFCPHFQIDSSILNFEYGQRMLSFSIRLWC